MIKDFRKKKKKNNGQFSFVFDILQLPHTVIPREGVFKRRQERGWIDTCRRERVVKRRQERGWIYTCRRERGVKRRDERGWIYTCRRERVDRYM